MEIEFNGIDADTLREICSQNNVSAEILQLSARDAICARKEAREFADGSSLYLIDESCCRGYYYCGNYNCGRTTKGSRTVMGGRGPRGSMRSKRTGRSSSDGCNTSGSNCNTSGDCDSSNDSSGAIIIFFLILIVFFLLIYLSPYILPMVALGIEFVLAVLFGLFDVISFGVFRKKFRRVLVHFPTPPSQDEMHTIITDAASFGGLSRGYQPQYGSNGFWLLRTGAYLFFPSLISTLLVLYLQPENDILFRLPIICFIVSLIFVWVGNQLVNRKAKEIATKV